MANTAGQSTQRMSINNTFEAHDNDALAMQTEISSNVGGYFPNIPPEAFTVYKGDMELTPRSGELFYRVAGTDTSTTENSFIYFKLYDHLHLPVQAGTKLKYWVYHAGGSHSGKMAVDLIFSDGSNLREAAHVTDTHGNRLHPAHRKDPLNQWVQVEVDLSPLAGRYIQKVLVAYDDDDVNNTTGKFRSYFDDLYIGPEQNVSAKIVSHTIPDKMIVGETYPVSVTVKNTGMPEWTEQQMFRLGAVDDGDPLSVTGRIVLPNDTKVTYGNTHTFHFTMIAPPKKGVYTTDWRMLQEQVTWFGEKLAVNVHVLSKDEPIVAHTVPTVIPEGGKRTVSVQIRNTTKGTWSSDNISLHGQGAAASFQAGTIKPQLGIQLKSGEAYTFEFPITAPQQFGTYKLGWQLYFGDTSFGQALQVQVHVSRPGQQTQFLYNANNQLTDMLTMYERIHMKYDAQGNRVSRVKTNNLLPNHDFEQQELHWTLSSFMKIDAHSKDKGMQIKFHSTSPVVGTASESFVLPVSPNTKYVLQADFLNLLKGGIVYVDTVEFNERNESVYDGAAIFSTRQGEWTTNALTITTQPTTKKVIVRVVADSQAIGEAYADNVQFYRAEN
ncbi:NBR1-Ig-like domain-containing protein [Paenibacillus sp. 481]|uniref:NBR1-Ig-like domain-containing protein n=1 Tax=Paenibacillus sp. 481 TaxID=2835869 RepID=UPI001E46FEEB|nr:NBR1-Ig-like domain-containing protein [Paenibacillus sp. 481]UHA73720.1 hypothetical protein KIK04_00650 [Paenibacillus sp. 481]